MRKGRLAGWCLWVLGAILLHNSAMAGVIINEWSQGNGGIKEWVEILVTSYTDMRGWVLHDKQGNDSGGIYVKFQPAPDTFWESVPPGTLIVIYNGEERDDTLPPDDLFLTDGDFTVIAPHNNSGLFKTGENRWLGVGNPASDDSPILEDDFGTNIHDWDQGDKEEFKNSPPRPEADEAVFYKSAGVAGVANADNYQQIEATETYVTPGEPNGGINTDWINALRASVTPIACLSSEIIVTRSDDAGPGTLRQALSDICPGGTIIIKPDVKLTSGPLTVDRNVILKADPLDYSQGNRTLRRAADAPEFPLFTVETNVSLCLEELSLTGGNSPNGPGGAVRFVGGDAQGGRLSAKRCTFYANQAQTGGAIYNLHGQVRLENCTFSGNQSLGHGGAICNGSRYGRIRMVHCTVCANLAMGRGGGIANLSGRVTLQNSLVTGNLSAQAGPDLYGEFIGDGYNLIGDTGDSHGWGETDLTGISWDQVIAPWLADNGGGVLTHALIPTGPAVNGGDPAVTVIEEAPPWFDNRGYGFLRVENGRTDIGAYEYAALPGDLDGNGVVALADAVLGLKLLAGIAVDRLNPAAELVEDGDGVIGMAEIGHILRSISRR